VFAEGPADLGRRYGVRAQTSWAGIGADGVIVMSRGSHRQGEGYWRGVLDRLRAA